MASKAKKVTYRDQSEDNADYLIPSQYDQNPSLPTRTESPEKSPASGGLFGSIYLPISLALYAGVPISQFVIGLIYIGRCTIKQFISIYMILSGAFGIAWVVIGLIIYMLIRKQSSSSSYDRSKSNPLILRILIPIFIILLLFVIAWFIAGQVIVLEVKTTVELFDPVLPEYCHGNLYKPAYILIFVDYLIFFIIILLFIISCTTKPADSDSKKNTKRPVRNSQK